MRWLPSRHHFALARLIALVMLKTTRPSPRNADRVVFAVDRHQSTIENYAVSIWFLITMTCYIAALLPLSAPVAVVTAFPLAMIAIQIAVVAGGLLVRSMRANAFVMMLGGVTASLHFATRATWARFAAYAFLGVVALNAVAYVVMWLLRDHVRELELRCAA